MEEIEIGTRVLTRTGKFGRVTCFHKGINLYGISWKNNPSCAYGEYSLEHIKHYFKLCGKPRESNIVHFRLTMDLHPY